MKSIGDRGKLFRNLNSPTKISENTSVHMIVAEKKMTFAIYQTDILLRLAKYQFDV